jgi:pyruvate ferredoxin oxidoreductase delta subunit
VKKWDIKDAPKWKYNKYPQGCTIPEAGNARQYETGSWRSQRPVLDKEKCSNCLFCWIYCPDSAIQVKDGKIEGFDLEHCKGCGICAEECPKKAIAMEEEAKFRKDD